jgi:hypothetical protein
MPSKGLCCYRDLSYFGEFRQIRGRAGRLESIEDRRRHYKLPTHVQPAGTIRWQKRCPNGNRPSPGSHVDLPPELAAVPTRLRGIVSGVSFVFVANGTMLERDITEIATVSPVVRERPSGDGCPREFILSSAGIGAADIHSLSGDLSH